MVAICIQSRFGGVGLGLDGVGAGLGRRAHAGRVGMAGSGALSRAFVLADRPTNVTCTYVSRMTFPGHLAEQICSS